MKVGFLLNQIDNRGTGNAVFDYAHYNEKILGNQSIICTLDMQPRNKLMETRLRERFTFIHDYPPAFPAVDVLYHLKSGERDVNWNFPNIRYAVHAVFNASEPHGDRYAAISEWLGKHNNVPWVPHIINLPESTLSLRGHLNIPDLATVFGRHGGRDTFDIPFAWSAINRALEKKEDIYFIFLNTDKPPIDFHDPKRVIFLDETADPLYKRKFINTCDAMLHARQRGETFGIAVGEFSAAKKRIIAYGDSPEKAHIGGNTYIYFTEEDLLKALLINWHEQGPVSMLSNYDECVPEKVMKKFKEVFLD